VYCPVLPYDRFKIAAVNAAGVSNFSEPSNGVTTEINGGMQLFAGSRFRLSLFQAVCPRFQIVASRQLLDLVVWRTVEKSSRSRYARPTCFVVLLASCEVIQWVPYDRRLRRSMRWPRFSCNHRGMLNLD
jgi:hypothetical protein